MANTDSPIIFLNSHVEDLENILSSVKEILDNHSIQFKSEDTYILLTILNDCCLKEEGKLDEYLKQLTNDDNVRNSLITFINEEKDNILSYMREFEGKRKSNYLYLKKFEWKFIGLSSPNDLIQGIIKPKILVKLYFHDGSEKLFETDFCTIKKLQEEIDECLAGFHSTYSRRIDNFEK